jgi:hypothetical protein
MHRYTPALLLSAALLTACSTATNAPMRADAAGTLEGRSVVLSRYAKQDFSALTAGKGAFAAVGAGAAVSTGNELVKQEGIADPAVAVSDALGKRLAQRYRLTPKPAGMEAKSDNVGELAQTYAGSDLLLDVKTQAWGFVYYPTDWSHYRIMYNARLRLIDLKTKAVLAEGTCVLAPEKTADSPTYEELLAQNAARLKREFAGAETACIDKFATQTLKL